MTTTTRPLHPRATRILPGFTEEQWARHIPVWMWDRIVMQPHADGLTLSAPLALAIRKAVTEPRDEDHYLRPTIGQARAAIPGIAMRAARIHYAWENPETQNRIKELVDEGRAIYASLGRDQDDLWYHIRGNMEARSKDDLWLVVADTRDGHRLADTLDVRTTIAKAIAATH